MAAGLVLGAGAALSYWSTPSPLQARLVESSKDQEALELICDTCPDHTVVRHGTSQVGFERGRAVLPLGARLPVGVHEVSLRLDRPGLRRDETLKVQVPVDYRMTTDLSELRASPPSAALVFTVLPGTRVEIAGQTLRLDAQHAGRHRIDLSKSLDSAALTAPRLALKVPYLVIAPDGRELHGSAELVTPVVPLELGAPGPRLITEHATVRFAGRSAPRARLTIGASQLSADAAGRFEHNLTLEALGEQRITVRADLDGMAPRLAHVIVDRVESEAAAAARFRQTAMDGYGRLARAPDAHKGAAVAFEGRVVEQHTAGDATLLLLDVRSGCAAARCLAQVEYRQPIELPAGTLVAVFGRLTASADGATHGQRVPSLSAVLVRRLDDGRERR